jgi:hypothetical protein
VAARCLAWPVKISTPSPILFLLTLTSPSPPPPSPPCSHAALDSSRGLAHAPRSLPFPRFSLRSPFASSTWPAVPSASLPKGSQRAAASSHWPPVPRSLALPFSFTGEAVTTMATLRGPRLRPGLGGSTGSHRAWGFGLEHWRGCAVTSARTPDTSTPVVTDVAPALPHTTCGSLFLPPPPSLFGPGWPGLPDRPCLSGQPGPKIGPAGCAWAEG